MKFLPESCCFCLKISKAYKMIIYCDFLHFVLQTVFVFLFFFSAKSMNLCIIVDILCYFSLFNQTFHALKSLNYSFTSNNLSLHKRYFTSKFVFFLLVLLKVSINFNTQYIFFDSNAEKSPIPEVFAQQIIVEIVWAIADLYFLMIMCAFLLRLKSGQFDFIGGTAIFEGNTLDFQHIFLKDGVNLEVNGYLVIEEDLKTADFVENGEIIAKNLRNFNRKRYLKIFPKPVLRNFKETLSPRVCDLTSIQSKTH